MGIVKRSIIGLMALAQTGAAQAEQAAHPVVIELFTSQGCSSCPPADEIIAKYADRKDVLPLSFHVDYWDRLGWKDPYSSPEATARQRQYAQYMKANNVYTPQAVVQGKFDAVGSNSVALKLALHRAQGGEIWITPKLARNGNSLDIRLPAASAVQADIVLIGFTRHHQNAVPRGENSGRTLTHRNSVTSIRSLGVFSGGEKTLAEATPAGDGVAVLLQSRADGAIIGAAWL